jgi:hypothetical protein
LKARTPLAAMAMALSIGPRSIAAGKPSHASNTLRPTERPISEIQREVGGALLSHLENELRNS